MAIVARIRSRSRYRAGAPETAQSSARVMPGRGWLDRGPMRDVAIEGGGELCLIVGVDLGIVAAARD